jgi:hypothetical protein
LILGDLIHTTTLLPGEKVRMFTSDRHSRFSYDETKHLAYHQGTTSEESYFMAGMADSVSNFASLDATHSSSLYAESAVSGGGGAGIDLGFLEIGGSASASSHSALTVSDFLHVAASHAETSSRHVEAGVRAASSTSVGEVQSRNHAQGESEDEYESASREFANPNHCHAISFFFYKLMKKQTLRFTLESIERIIIDPVAKIDTRPNKVVSSKISIRAETVSATAPNREALERMDRDSLAEKQAADMRMSRAARMAGIAADAAPLEAKVRKDTLGAVDAELREAGLIDAAGNASKELVTRVNWERTMLLPTAGVIVKGCLDDCNICEKEECRRRELELERMELENKLLARKIELLHEDRPALPPAPPAAPDPHPDPSTPKLVPA